MPEQTISELCDLVRVRSTKDLLEVLETIQDELIDRVVPEDDENVTMRGGIRPTTVGNP